MTPTSRIRRPPDILRRQAGPPRQAGASTPAVRGLAWWVSWFLLAAALVALGSLAGLWYLPFAAGVLLGVAGRLGRLGVAACGIGLVLLGPVAWGADLAVMSLRGAAIGATARIAAAIAGLPPLAALTIVLTLLVALLQAAAGLWLGRALAPRRRAGRPRRAAGELEDSDMP